MGFAIPDNPNSFVFSVSLMVDVTKISSPCINCMYRRGIGGVPWIVVTYSFLGSQEKQYV